MNTADVSQHHGMISTLQNGTTGIFHVHDIEGESGKTDDQDL